MLHDDDHARPDDDDVCDVERVEDQDSDPVQDNDYEYAVEPLAPPAAIVLSPEQEQALADAREHTFTYISGTAGTGKTRVAAILAKQAKGVDLTATTGIAAVNLEGTTIHSLLHFHTNEHLKQNYMDGYIQSTLRKLARAGTTRIVLDEVSMLSGQSLSYLTRAIIDVNEGNYEALEGVGEDDESQADVRDKAKYHIGLTLVGDFGQLPPVPDTGRDGKKLPVQFAFESPEWRHFAPHTTKLTRIFRQDDLDFVRALHAVRRGDRTKALQFFTDDKFSLQMDDTFDGTTIFAKNDSVDRYNYDRMSRLSTSQVSCTTTRRGEQRPEWKKQIPDVVTLKEGALVMLLANRREFAGRDDTKGRILYSNGDLGHFLGKDEDGEWVVRLKRTGREVEVKLCERENLIPLAPGRRKEIRAGIEVAALRRFGPVDEEDRDHEQQRADWIKMRRAAIIKEKFEVIGSVDYMPLRPAYGCTVHKTQGLTLDDVQVNIRDPFFQQPGMLFVALSRARSAAGLRIIGNQRGFAERCTVNPKVAPWL